MRAAAPSEERSNDDEDGDLRDTWRSFCVSASLSPRHGDSLTLLRPYHVLGTSRDEQGLWYLSLTSRNPDLLRSMSHLFVELNAQYQRCVEEGDAILVALRDRHAQQLTALLEVANDTKDMIVSSDVTEHVVLRHQCELETLQRQVRDRSARLAVELREGFFAFLKTTAPDVAAAYARDRSRLSSSPVLPASPLATVDISHFAQEQWRCRRRKWGGRRPIVQTVELPNPLRLEIAGLRPNDAAVQPVVIGVSPTSSLRKCLACLYPSSVDNGGIDSSEDQDEGEEEAADEEEEEEEEEEDEEKEEDRGAHGLDDVHDSVVRAVQSHLHRLAQHTHAVLFLIGTRTEAETILAVPGAELLLHETHPNAPFNQCEHTAQDLDERRQCFAPLPDHEHLLLMRSTRHFGANAILLWTPAPPPPPPPLSSSSAAAAFASAAPFAEDALRLSYAWGADMFTVAVLRSAQALSMDVLRQLQRGMARLAYEADGARASWTAPEDPLAEGALSADASQTALNALSVRAFLPLRIASFRSRAPAAPAAPVPAAAGAAAHIGAQETWRGRRRRRRRAGSFSGARFGASFSSEQGAMRMNGEGTKVQQMSLDKLLVYTFGDSVVMR